MKKSDNRFIDKLFMLHLLSVPLSRQSSDVNWTPSGKRKPLSCVCKIRLIKIRFNQVKWSCMVTIS